MKESEFRTTARRILDALFLNAPSEDVDAGIDWEALGDEPQKAPRLLRRFYSLAVQSDEVMTSHHRFYRPESLAFHQNRLLFCEENECVVYWGIEASRLGEDDPPVAQWNTHSETWHGDCPLLSLFLLNLMSWQLLNASPAVARADNPERLLPMAEKLMSPVSTTIDRYDLRSFYSDGIVCCFLLPQLIFVGAGSEHRLTQWQQEFGLELELL